MNGFEFLDINGFELKTDKIGENKRILLNLSECESIEFDATKEHDSYLRGVLVRLKNGRELLGVLDQRKIEMYTTKSETDLLAPLGFPEPLVVGKDK